MEYLVVSFDTYTPWDSVATYNRDIQMWKIEIILPVV